MTVRVPTAGNAAPPRAITSPRDGLELPLAPLLSLQASGGDTSRRKEGCPQPFPAGAGDGNHAFTGGRARFRPPPTPAAKAMRRDALAGSSVSVFAADAGRGK